MPDSPWGAKRKSNCRAYPSGEILDAKAITLASAQLVYTVVDRPSHQWRIPLLLFGVSLAIFFAGLAVLLVLWNVDGLNGMMAGGVVRQINAIDLRLQKASDTYQNALDQAVRARDPLQLFDAASAYESELKFLIFRTQALAKAPTESQPATHAMLILKERLNVVEKANLLMLDGAYSAEFRSSAFGAVHNAQTYSSSQAERERALLRTFR